MENVPSGPMSARASFHGVGASAGRGSLVSVGMLSGVAVVSTVKLGVDDVSVVTVAADAVGVASSLLSEQPPATTAKEAMSVMIRL